MNFSISLWENSVVPSAGFDAEFSGGLHAGGAGRFGANTAPCRVDVDFGTAAARSSVGEDAFFPFPFFLLYSPCLP